MGDAEAGCGHDLGRAESLLETGEGGMASVG